MKRMLMLVAATTMVLAMTVPAYAQQREVTIRAIAEGAPSPPKYQVTEEGTLIIEGDVLIGCQDIIKTYTRDPRVYLDESERKYVEACKKAGFPPSDTLPQTGGVPFVLVPVALLVGGGLLSVQSHPAKHDARAYARQSV